MLETKSFRSTDKIIFELCNKILPVTNWAIWKTKQKSKFVFNAVLCHSITE